MWARFTFWGFFRVGKCFCKIMGCLLRGLACHGCWGVWLCCLIYLNRCVCYICRVFVVIFHITHGFKIFCIMVLLWVFYFTYFFVSDSFDVKLTARNELPFIYSWRRASSPKCIGFGMTLRIFIWILHMSRKIFDGIKSADELTIASFWLTFR